MTRQHRLLVVDDEASMRELLEIVLQNAGYEVASATTADEALERLEEKTYDAVLTDLRMGSDREAGMNVLAWLKENSPATPAIMITAYGSVENAIEAMKHGATDYIRKPFKNDEIRLRVKKALDERTCKRENEALKQEQSRRGAIESIVGQSAAVKELLALIRRVAGLPSTVAIYGESGTGKELVARAIHNLSDRADKPFVAINCGGIPENLLESEMFGYKKGAFTGAVNDKEGLFVVADGGTLFLDEIGEMPLSLQVKLLRVLDNSEVTPVGGAASVKVDVRIISATNRNLSERVRAGRFREDLFYRLNVIPITVPALRERKEDIPLLARHFLASHARKMGREVLELAPDAEHALRDFDWPGNVRELENAMERAVALCSKRVELSDLPPHIKDPLAGSELVSELPPSGLDLEGYVANIEMGLIKQALQNTKYSQKRAAELLGLTSRSLRYRLKKYNLESEED